MTKPRLDPFHGKKPIKRRQSPKAFLRRAHFEINLKERLLKVRIERKDFDVLCKYGGVEITNHDGTKVDVGIKDLDYE